MIGLELKAAQQGFFDRAVVEKKIDARTKLALLRFGAFVWTRDRTSLRYRKAVSAPGQPPSVHRSAVRTKTNRKTGATKTQAVSPLRESILFGYEEALGVQTVVIGPTLRSAARGGELALIEVGGTTTDARGRTLRYRPRPHTGPAFQAELTKLPGLLGT